MMSDVGWETTEPVSGLDFYNEIVDTKRVGAYRALPRDLQWLEGEIGQCFVSLPVDLSPVQALLDAHLDLFLRGSSTCLERLVLAVYNEEDRRIAPFSSKHQLLALLSSVVEGSRRGKVKVRSVLQRVPQGQWLDEVQPAEDIVKDMDKEVLSAMKQLMSSCWRIQRDLAREVVQSEEYSLARALHIFLTHYAAIAMQSLVRGFLSRRAHRRSLHAERSAQEADTQSWCAVAIQKVARGYIARKTVVKSMRVRKALSRPLLRIAERFAKKETDLWDFLSEMQTEFDRLQQEMREDRAREDNYASQFVEKVVVERERAFNTAWEQFPREVEKAREKGRERCGEIAVGVLVDKTSDFDQGKRLLHAHTSTHKPLAHPHSHSHTHTQPQSLSRSLPSTHVQAQSDKSPLRGDASPKKSQSRTLISVQEVERERGKERQSVPPGPLLRTAVERTVSHEVAHQLNALVNGSFRSRKLASEMRAVYEKEVAAAALPLTTHTQNRHNRSVSHGGSAKKKKNKNDDKDGTLPPLAAQAQVKAKAQRRRRMDGQPLASPMGQMQATHRDWLSESSLDVNNHNNTYEEERKDVSSSIEARGESLLLDVPQGLQDSIERLIYAAALRCYVPDFFRGNALPTEEREFGEEGEQEEEDNEKGDNSSLSIKEQKALRREREREKREKNRNADADYAHSVYLSLPAESLAKMRYELECRRWAQGVVNRLRVKGLHSLPQVAPLSKFVHTLQSVDAPRVLINKCAELYVELKKIGKVSLGLAYVDNITTTAIPTPAQTQAQAAQRGDDGQHNTSTEKDGVISVIVDEESAVCRQRSPHSPFSQRGASPQPTSTISKTNAQNKSVSFKGMNLTNEDIVAVHNNASNDEGDIARFTNAHGHTVTPSPNSSSPSKKESLSLLERANMLLRDMLQRTESADWCRLDASVEEIFLQAAFLIVPHRSKHPQFDSTLHSAEKQVSNASLSSTIFQPSAQAEESEEERLMGNHAFKYYAMELLSLTDEKEKEDFVRARFRSSVILATPYTLYLKSQGVLTVEHLLRVDLPDLQMPKPLATQVEILLNIVVQNGVQARLLPVPRDLRNIRKEDFAVPLRYDSRFQRTPLDTMGKPPRALTITQTRTQAEGATPHRLHLRRSEEEREQRQRALQDVHRVRGSGRQGQRVIEQDLERDISLWSTQSHTHNRKKESDTTESDKDKKWSFSVDPSELSDQVSTPSLSKKKQQPLGVVAHHASSTNKTTVRGAAGEAIEVTLVEDDYSDSSASSLALHPHNADDQKYTTTGNKTNGDAKNKLRDKSRNVSERDFIAENSSLRVSIFKESHVCPYPHCGQVFSRAYTYKVHLKTHESFPQYHEYKRRPQLGLDTMG